MIQRIFDFATFKTNEYTKNQIKCPYYTFSFSLSNLLSFSLLGVLTRSLHPIIFKVLQLTPETDTDYGVILNNTTQYINSITVDDTQIQDFLEHLEIDNKINEKILRLVMKLLMNKYVEMRNIEVFDAVMSFAQQRMLIYNEVLRTNTTSPPDPVVFIKLRYLIAKYFNDNVFAMFEIGQCAMISSIILHSISYIYDELCPLCLINKCDLLIPLNRQFVNNSITEYIYI